jgi:hypothetical protein
LWQYLNLTGKILVLKTISSDDTGITTEFITELIESGDVRLSQYVPDQVYKHIKEHGLFTPQE